MANKTQTIRIESIAGGISSYDYSARADQFFNSLGIDPSSNDASITGRGSGFSSLKPTRPQSITSTAFTSVPLWIAGAPKTTTTFLYDMKGSVYTGTTGYADLNDGGDSEGDGMAYYNNYMYFARNTTVARLGPLDGDAVWTDDYWVTILSKAALGRQAYPSRNTGFTDAEYPRHVLHRHTDGKLYIADVVDNQGTIHYIKTTKTTYEGDTDDGSKYDALNLPYGYYPTDIESLGDDLVISAFEGRRYTDSTTYPGGTEGRAALFFWDTTSDNFYRIIQREFPDQIITALENSNGVLYTFSCNPGTEPTGLRVLRYLGGRSFEQVLLLPDIDAPFAGGTTTQLNQIFFGSTNSFQSYGRPAIWSIGLPNEQLSNATYAVTGARSSAGAVHAIYFEDSGAPWAKDMMYSYANSNNSATLERFGGNTSAWDTDLMNSTSGHAYWFSNWYKIGNNFKITKIRFNLLNTLTSEADIAVLLSVDASGSPVEVGTLNSTNYPSSVGLVTIRPPHSNTGCLSFQIGFKWRGTSAPGIEMPIEVDYEIIPSE